MIVQTVLSNTQILDFLHTSHFNMGLTCTEIKTALWMSFSSFIRSGSLLSEWKSSAMVLSGWGLGLFEQIHIFIYFPVYRALLKKTNKIFLDHKQIMIWRKYGTLEKYPAIYYYKYI